MIFKLQSQSHSSGWPLDYDPHSLCRCPESKNQKVLHNQIFLCVINSSRKNHKFFHEEYGKLKIKIIVCFSCDNEGYKELEDLHQIVCFNPQVRYIFLFFKYSFKLFEGELCCFEFLDGFHHNKNQCWSIGKALFWPLWLT